MNLRSRWLTAALLGALFLAALAVGYLVTGPLFAQIGRGMVTIAAAQPRSGRTVSDVHRHDRTARAAVAGARIHGGAGSRFRVAAPSTDDGARAARRPGAGDVTAARRCALLFMLIGIGTASPG